MPKAQPVYRQDGNQTLQSCTLMLRALEALINFHVPGDVVEIGCYKGKTSVMLAEMLRDRGEAARNQYLYDAFDGMPDQGEEDAGTSIARGDLKATVEDVRKSFEDAGLPGPWVCPGWIEDTLPAQLPDLIAFALIDVDFHKPILHALRSVFPRLADDGICIVDDVDLQSDSPLFPGAVKAVKDFLQECPEAHLVEYGDRQVAITRRGLESDALNAAKNLRVEQKDAVQASEPRTFSVCFATFPYGGNGGAPNTTPEVEKWLRKTIHKAKLDPRIKEVFEFEKADTPITMTRNAAVWACRNQKIDFLVMVDSDMHPDFELNHHHDSSQKPFWDVAIDFLVDHWEKGPACVAAPYCGPPPNEVPYVFHWTQMESGDPGCGFSLEMYSREYAEHMAGIQPVAALPTGLIMFDVRLFELTAPKQQDFAKRIEEWLTPCEGRTLEAHLISEIAARCEHEKFKDCHSWFYYEYIMDSDGRCYESQKASTEDVTATRDISLAGIQAYGYNPIFCAWSSWAGHIKPKTVGKPRGITAEVISEKFVEALKIGATSERVTVDAAELIRTKSKQAA